MRSTPVKKSPARPTARRSPGRPHKPGGERRPVTLYMPVALMNRLRREALREHRSLSEHVHYLLVQRDLDV